jgi:hypothetical protein
LKCKHPGCKSYALKDSSDGLCFWHSHTTAEKRRQAGRKGGARGKLDRSDNIKDMSDVKRILSETIAELRTDSTNVVSRARAVGYLLSVWVTAYEKSDLEARIAALEARIAEKDIA